ncbi:M50 family metallopeptidase, partial [Candidatus Woesearchaeota archaeon]|nr:M50 family metallopeptidase [Candidatus Woesearchaeota archaeon]
LIPAAFVEPDEKQLRKASRFKQLSVYAAGPFANIVFGFACLGLFLLVLNPLTASMYNYEGVQVKEFMPNSPAEISGMATGEIITQINDIEIKNTEDFLNSIEGAEPGDVKEIKTKDNTYSVQLTEDPAEKDAFLGIWVMTEKSMKNQNIFSYFIVWVTDLFYWLFLLNLGVGLFNLVPIGPIDGGRMLQSVLEKVMHNKHATRVWHTVSAVVLMIILSNVIYAFIA